MTISWEEKLRKTEEIAQVMQRSVTDLMQLRLPDCCSFDHKCALYCLLTCLLFACLGCVGASEAVGESGHFIAVLRN